MWWLAISALHDPNAYEGYIADHLPDRDTDRCSGRTLPVDAFVVWQRTQSLLGSNATPPERIIVSRAVPRTYHHPEFYQLLTACREPMIIRGAGGRVQSSDTVQLYAGSNTSAATTEMILAHEYTHVVQLKTATTRNLPNFVLGALLQGGAIYSADTYVQTYL